MKVNEYNYETEVLQSPVPVVILCAIEHEGDVRYVIPRIELNKIAGNYKDQVKVMMLDVNDFDTMDLRAFYKVVEIPMVLIIKNGEIIDSKTGIEFIIEDDIISALGL
ncbi:thioredoxin domain-containing protein [Bacillus sp. R1-10]